MIDTRRLTPEDAPESVEMFGETLKLLRSERERMKGVKPRRPVVPESWRKEIQLKTNGRCHICGGSVEETDWQADHVLAHAGGGVHAIDNYLPAHRLCNIYRWYYLPEELQYILKLGVMVRTIIEKGKMPALAAHFVAHEQRRAKRRKSRAEGEAVDSAST